MSGTKRCESYAIHFLTDNAGDLNWRIVRSAGASQKAPMMSRLRDTQKKRESGHFSVNSEKKKRKLGSHSKSAGPFKKCAKSGCPCEARDKDDASDHIKDERSNKCTSYLCITSVGGVGSVFCVLPGASHKRPAPKEGADERPKTATCQQSARHKAI